jgi:hypothetical protein
MCLSKFRTEHVQVRCLSLDKVKFDMLLGSVQDVLAKRMRIRILQSVPLLSKLPEAKLVKLSNVMRVQAFADGKYSPTYIHIAVRNVNIIMHPIIEYYYLCNRYYLSFFLTYIHIHIYRSLHHPTRWRRLSLLHHQRGRSEMHQNNSSEQVREWKCMCMDKCMYVWGWICLFLLRQCAPFEVIITECM